MINTKVGLIGGGNMGRAIAGALLRGGMHATNLMVAEPLPEQCDLLRKELYGIMVTEENETVAAAAEILLFSVKPQILKPVCEKLTDVVQHSRPLIMSIAAGPKIDDIDQWLGGGLSVVRVMPNQPALIDQGISALFANQQTDEFGRDMAEKNNDSCWAGRVAGQRVENGCSHCGIRYRPIIFLFADRLHDRGRHQGGHRSGNCSHACG